MFKRLPTATCLDLFLLLVSAAITLYLRLDEPSLAYFDEVLFVPSARALLTGEGQWEVTHPPLGKLAMAASIAILGDQPVAWRFPSFVAGMALPGIVYLLIRRLEGSRFVALAAGAIVVCDGLCITQARIGMLNAPSLVLGLAALLSALNRRLIFAGVFFACAAATKFSALPFLPLIVIALLRREDEERRISGRTLGVAILLSGITYLLWFLLALRNIDGAFFSGLWRYHAIMVGHHLTAIEPHRYQSLWWSWPLALRPVWYGFESIASTENVRGVLCMANPVTSLVVACGVVFATICFVVRRRSSFGEGLVLGGFWVSFLPWAFSPRMTLYHYYYPALVFGVMVFALLIDRYSMRVKRVVVGGTLLGALAMGLYWYPLWTAMTISASRYESMIWFPRWR